jgi:hypothetical protein
MARNQGIRSNKLTHPGVRTGQRATKINPKGVAQYGTSRGNHATNRSALLTGDVEPVRLGKKPAGSPGGVVLGNEAALRASGSKAGPGCDRTILRSGGQGTHGPVAPGNPPPAGELFPGFGPKRG